MVRYLLVASLLTVPATVALAAPPLCATPEQAAKVQQLYGAPPSPLTFVGAVKLGLPEAVVVSALPASQAVRTSGAAVEAGVARLQAWDDATLVLLKGQNVVEVRVRIPPGAQSTKSQFYNLKQEGAGLSGHFRPDLLGAIYAVELTAAEARIRGVTFIDAEGQNAFGVYLPEGADQKPAMLAQYEKTRSVIAALPRVCP